MRFDREYSLKYLKFLGLVMCLGGGISSCSSSQANPTANVSANTGNPKVPITVTDKGCQPIEVSVPVGKNTFVITNQSSRVLEWEILQNGMVIEEKENIVPGFVQELKANLKAGKYEMACGLRSNPKGKISVGTP